MKLKNFIANLNELIENNPEVLEMDVISAKDAEGNGFNFVSFSPSIGMFNEHGEFYYDKEDFEDYYEDKEWKPNSICIN